MNPPLHLQVTDYENVTRWRWVLNDARDVFLADHEVKLDGDGPEARAFEDLPHYLRRYEITTPPAEILHRVGAWIGREVFGRVAEVLAEHLEAPATVVRVHVPDAARELLLRPFELAHVDGKPLAEAGVRLVYQLDGAAEPRGEKERTEATALRVLAVFSLPHGQSPLNLRRERVELERRLKALSQTRSTAVELRVLQYGATRKILQEALEEGDGWDLVHFSGHGLQGELALEDEHGEADLIATGELVPLLRPARTRLKLLTLSSCLSGAGTLRSARRELGLEEVPSREAAESEPEGEKAPEASVLPSLGQSLAEELDCAVLAMRYRVGDDFARDAVLGLYDRLLAKGQPLPAALQLALTEALKSDASPLSLVTPILFGPRAAGLTVVPPRREPSFVLPRTGLLGFPSSPERFVGRLRPMLRASQALAPESPYRGVLFHGMAGGGKTACALELAYRYERDRFAGLAWSKAPDRDQDIVGALVAFAQDLERQLPDLELVGLLDDPQDFADKALFRLKGLLQNRAILIVLDNIESLLTRKGGWRDPRWGELVRTLLDHQGTSRLVLTSRHLPADLEDHPALLREPIHALSFPESVLLARELPVLKELFAGAERRELLQRILGAAQGHPKLLELADHLAGTDREALERQLGRSEDEADLGDQAGERRRFFDTGETVQGPAAFIETLDAWTAAITANLPPTPRLMFHFLSRLEEDDRNSSILEANWKDFLKRIRDSSAPAAAALAEPEEDLTGALNRLASVGLVEIKRPPRTAEGEPGEAADLRLLRLHPAVAEAGRRETGTDVLEAVDVELGDYWRAMLSQGLETEMQGGGRLVVEAGKRATPYLLRAEQWHKAAAFLEKAIHRDSSPATLAMALPLLRKIASATDGTTEGLENAGQLANALSIAGRHGEAEAMLRDLITRCEEQGNYRQASVDAGHLINLLMTTGRSEEALDVAKRNAELTRRAGLGPWTQLANESSRLQLLNAMGRYKEVLTEVERLRKGLTELPEKRDAEEAANPWNVRETLLDTGREAAHRLKQWEAALSLNGEIIQAKEKRGADPVELARTRFNDHGPLLRLQRFAEARKLLDACRQAFEEARYIVGLGSVFSALANLENGQNNPSEAVKFEAVALRYSYQAGEPEDCAISHNNLGNYLERSDAPMETVVAHRLAASILRFQISSGLLGTTIHNLANSPLPSTPPRFDEIADRVEELDGVRFRELFARLPRRAPDGDAAIAEVWKVVQEKLEERSAGDAVMPELPPTVAAAFETGDAAQVHAAIQALPPEEKEAVLAQLQAIAKQAERDGQMPSDPPDMTQVLEGLDPLLRGIAAVARGNDEQRAAIESALSEVEGMGWQLTAAAQRIWAGDRDAQALTAGVDSNSGLLIERILELIELPIPEEVLAAAPDAVREAIEALDAEALKAALDQLPGEEARTLVAQLREAGILGGAPAETAGGACPTS
ncbi:MAG: CHAT domain-containing protein [bacterium]|nr:CHAT domain-containing protein [bacterium]